MTDLLIDEGANPGGGLGALAHGNIAAAERLIALTAAAFYGNSHMLGLLLNAGVTPNGYPVRQSGFHTHATPLHQAVYSGSLECVKLLVEAGARLDAKDKAWDGTPLGWAMYMPTEEGYDDAAKQRFAAIEKYLRETENMGK
jgi:peptide-methionine (S)-S-oxide reductase